MKLATRLAVLLSCLLAPLALAAQSAQVDWLRRTDFSRFRTFTWATAPYPIQDPDASLAMANAIQEELGAKGVRWVDPKGTFDSFVAYTAIIGQDVQDSSRKLITLKVVIFDGSNNTIVWRAGGFVPLVNNSEQDRRNVRALLAEMFRQYPPE